MESGHGQTFFYFHRYGVLSAANPLIYPLGLVFSCLWTSHSRTTKLQQSYVAQQLRQDMTCLRKMFFFYCLDLPDIDLHTDPSSVLCGTMY
jgi:hypothetical protein